jgi:hypothetical protein
MPASCNASHGGRCPSGFQQRGVVGSCGEAGQADGEQADDPHARSAVSRFLGGRGRSESICRIGSKPTVPTSKPPLLAATKAWSGCTRSRRSAASVATGRTGGADFPQRCQARPRSLATIQKSAKAFRSFRCVRFLEPSKATRRGRPRSARRRRTRATQSEQLAEPGAPLGQTLRTRWSAWKTALLSKVRGDHWQRSCAGAG